jgi:AmmeMemoRadiSam system protein B
MIPVGGRRCKRTGDGMRTRTAVVAGQFYPARRDECEEEVRQCLAARPVGEAPASVVGGIVPHAGWVFSGELAAMVFAAVKLRHETVHTFVVFGTAHSYFAPLPAVDDSDAWETPLGTIEIDAELRDALLSREVVVANGAAHRREHSVEVQVPFIQHLFPGAKLLPVVTPPVESAIPLGEEAARLTTGLGRTVIYIGSTDLTHYGPRYGFTPMGKGPEGLQWSANVNDRQFIDLAVALEPQRLLAEAMEKTNACGPGAAAAAIAAARTLGATQGALLAYTNSNEVMQTKMSTTSRDSVGYAAIIF